VEDGMYTGIWRQIQFIGYIADLADDGERPVKTGSKF